MDELSKSFGDLSLVQTLEMLVERTIKPALAVQKEIERILPTDPYLAGPRSFAKNITYRKWAYKIFKNCSAGFAHSPVFCFKIQ